MANQKTDSKARTAYTVEHLYLLDGTVIEVRNLSIKALKKANRIIKDAFAGNEVTDDEGNPKLDAEGQPVFSVDEDEVTDAFLQVLAMVMERQEGKIAEKYEGEEGLDELSDNVDQETLYEVVRIATGIDFLAASRQMQDLMQRDQEANRQS